MAVFVQAPFWALPYARAAAPHALSVRVSPAVTITSSSIANPTVLVTATPHGFVTGDTVAIAGHTGSTPALAGAQVVTVIDATHFSVPVNVSVGGTGGTATRTSAVGPLTLTEAKLYARLTGTDLDSILPGHLETARSRVESDTGIVLLLSTFDVFFDAIPYNSRMPIELPWRPVPTVIDFASFDTEGDANTLDVSNYELDPSSEAPYPARLALSTSGSWPSDLRPFQPYVVRIRAGWSTTAEIPKPLVHAVGALFDYYVNKDRETLDLYEDTIAPFRLMTVA